jgi:LysR family transcriptional regulator (chromosome initiation inhibitor)
MTFMPTSWGFVQAALAGLGWAIVPEDLAQPALAAGTLTELVAGTHADIPLFWERWRLSSRVLDALTAAVQTAAAAKLKPDHGLR